jgi:microcystin-dependent protein
MANRLNVQNIYASDSDTTAALTISSTDGISAPGLVGMIASFAMSSAPSGWLPCNGANYESGDYSDLYTAITSTWVTAWANGESITTGDFRKNASGTIYIATSTGTTSGTDVGDDVGVTWSTTTKFLVPDLRGEFLRGWDNGQGKDPDTANRIGGDAVGSSQGHSIVNHSHNVYGGSHTGNADYGFRRLFTGSGYPDGAIYGSSTGHKVALTNYNTYFSNVAEVKRIQAHDVIGNYAQNNGSSTTSENRPRNKNVQYCIKY